MSNQVQSTLAQWAQAKVSVVAPHLKRHSIHPYFNVCPESPDGRWVLYFTSHTSNGHEGDIRILERESGEEKILAENVTVEDAHRVACQQWVSGGRRVVFHDLREGEWVIVAVDIETLEQRVLAKGRQIGWGQPNSDIVPLYGPHWDPNAYRDLEFLNVETGEARTVVCATTIAETYPEWVEREFGAKPISIFFPILSPDCNRILFKTATPAGGDFRSKNASIRKWLLCYDLKESRFRFIHQNWGHPAWHPDARTLINVPNLLIDTDTGDTQAISELPKFPGSHPSVSPDGTIFLTDAIMKTFGGGEKEWGVVVGDINGHDFEIIHRFDHSQGATSWRPTHPHPIFSADGERIYFNTNSTRWTQLCVAQRAT